MLKTVAPESDVVNERLATGDTYTGRVVLPTEGERNPQIRPHGKGKLRHPNGAVYEGTFLRGKRHGNGVLKFANGDVYEGCFAHDGICGQGKFIDAATGTKYVGKFGTKQTHMDAKLPDMELGMAYKGLVTCKGLRPLPIEPAPEISPTLCTSAAALPSSEPQSRLDERNS